MRFRRNLLKLYNGRIKSEQTGSYVKKSGYEKMRKIQILFAAIFFLTVAGCDKFFYIEAIVTDANTYAPIPNAKATLVLDRGYEEPDVTQVTDANGVIFIMINEPCTAWATLTVEKPGYQSWSTQFRGSPEGTVVIRLKGEKEK